MKFQYHHLVLGGTFDHVHIGHEALLTRALSLASHVTIGLTSDAYISRFKSHHASFIQSFQLRKQALEIFIALHGWGERVTIVPINTAAGPTVDSEQGMQFDVILVTPDTKMAATGINDQRKALDLPLLVIEEMQMVNARDDQKISSTRIRAGEVDMNGNLLMPEMLRISLAEPFGKVFSDKDFTQILTHCSHKVLITVGDRTTHRFASMHRIPDLSIIDNFAMRQPFVWDEDARNVVFSEAKIERIVSGPSYISQSAIVAIQAWANTLDRTVIEVDGEEDLLVLPVLVHAPLHSVVCYGQPGHGLVVVDVTDEVKNRAQTILSSFTVVQM